MSVYAFVYAFLNVCVYVYVYMYMYMFVFMCMYTCLRMLDNTLFLGQVAGSICFGSTHSGSTQGSPSGLPSLGADPTGVDGFVWYGQSAPMTSSIYGSWVVYICRLGPLRTTNCFRGQHGVGSRRLDRMVGLLSMNIKLLAWPLAV